ncbi:MULTISPECIES: TauD/TfdA family dioxygenase [unclassified Phenylobacterium]|uniref:TauD/TfdA family dioxygenase n=1 Tax=unclassified Phenylobacterium TaxID=2640670 RepID=UPI00083B7EA5|nr:MULTISPECIES: TauD/TfdA family dioxygenase [unclassified Phenylobacterium]
MRLPGAAPTADVDALAEVVWRRLRTGHGIARERPETWTVPHPAQLAVKGDELAAMASPTVRAVLDQLLGVDGWTPPERWGLPLVTLPGFAAHWDLPHKGWHSDIPATAEPPRVVRVFLLLGDLAAGGGGTDYIAGSYRVLRALARDDDQRLKSGEARKRLMAREPWFAALFSRPTGEDRRARFMDQPDEAGGVPVRVGEMTGRAGDVYVMDPLILHAVTPNALPQPRLMLTEWVYARP